MKTFIGMKILTTAIVGILSVSACSKSEEVADIPAPSTTVGTEIDDSVVTTAVKSALLADADVRSVDFKVETRKGVVQLSGFVDDQLQLDRAVDVVSHVAGVKSVENNVSLKGAATTVGNKVDDATITAKVKAALLSDVNIKSTDIAVVTRKDEVQLSGFVDNQGQIDRAIEIARGVEGVSSVTNQMSIKK